MNRVYSFWVIFYFTVSILSGCKSNRGCTDASADNFDQEANKNDGSCTYNFSKLCQTWNLYKYEVNGSDSTEPFLTTKPAYHLIFFREKTYKEVFQTDSANFISHNGIWDFDQDYSLIRLTQKPENTVRECWIVNFTDQDLKLQIQGSTQRNYYFQPK